MAVALPAYKNDILRKENKEINHCKLVEISTSNVYNKKG